MNVKLLSAEWRAVRRAALRVMHGSLSLVGLVSVGIVGLLVAHPDYARAVGRWVVPGPEPVAAVGAAFTVPVPALPASDKLVEAIAHPGGEAGRLLGLAAPQDEAPGEVKGVTRAAISTKANGTAAGRDGGREKREITNYLSKKYRVNGDAVAMLVDAAYMTGKDLGLDPLLLLSVMGVESGFNPFAESTAGASGLMQLMAKVHRDKLDDFGGANIALNPVVNLRVGAVVLKDCIRRGGSLVDGLRLYVGAGAGDDSGYGTRVLQEKDRLVQVLRGNVGALRVESRAAPRIEARIEPRIEPIPVRADKAAPVARETQPVDHRATPDTVAEPKPDAHQPNAASDEPGRVAAL